MRDTIIAALGFAYAIFAIWGTGWDIIGKGFLLLMVGLPVYVYMGWIRRRGTHVLEPIETPSFEVTGTGSNGRRREAPAVLEGVHGR